MSETLTNAETAILDPTRAAFDAHATVADLGRTHFIGIGGAGMSVLAEMLHERGVVVDGSDREASSKTERLQALGITVEFGQRAQNVADAQTVVYSSAIKPDNPEIVAAHEAGKAIVHRSDILALLMNDRRAVTVAGAHGKTTTSSLLAHILVHAGEGALADPSYAIGGSIQAPGGGTLDGGHAGEGQVLVAEADESDGSFEKYHPDIAIITNAEADHLDHYGTEEHYCAAFVEHAGHAKNYVIMSGDDEGARAVLRALDPQISAHTIITTTQTAEQFGDTNGATLVTITSESEQADSGVEQFTMCVPAALIGAAQPLNLPVRLAIPGIHNARNATAAITAAMLLGLDPHKAAEAASSFLGAARRFQVCGSVGDVTVVDDYAHHPTEIDALLHAARRRYPQAVLRVLFQPHLFSRTKFFAHEFAQALSLADDVIVTGIFPAREKQEDFPEISARTIADAAADIAHDPASWISAVDDMHTAAQMLAMRANPGDVILTVGAGDITTMTQVILHALDARYSAGER
ncbi:UDP-N-acetylmuramate--L-alanine ligase [Bifidobacterium goeldii]|uniref:UDP-N-acetylmuramate--L-alanine ligase n=1 Tax=Bifidobacterium goeldii TaxID=2306975 RepID=A0A430FN52_9BIFI|nr:UDP-N-acetylmuramate--L-alanine ligase [Bifidobacterium goeldii]RSX54255.1 UDP-N-acetylmuramate--L-alanine ligase [Bifidobacterium goeldii]